MNVVTRFAPSPTGALHLGGARTALFSYLWAMHTKGKFLLRIEDTDTERSKEEHTEGILASMRWLGLSWSEPLWYQSQRLAIYKKYVQQLLDTGHAYYCTCTAEEVEQMREEAKLKGEQPKYNGACREKGLSYVEGAVVRLKTPFDTDLCIEDGIKGSIVINTKELDDMILCRADGNPTYNLAVVVDDYEMGVTHVIRGDDHIANTPKQILIYQALGLPLPSFAHVPMILGADKQKLSKRHGATAVIDYERQGFLPQAMVNYLVRLGWSHGDEELFTLEQLQELFSIEGVNASPSAIDFDKLRWVNAHYIKTLPTEYIAACFAPFIQDALVHHGITEEHASFRYKHAVGNEQEHQTLLKDIVNAYKERAQTLIELAEQSLYCFLPASQLDYTNPPKKANQAIEHIQNIYTRLADVTLWEEATLLTLLQEYMQMEGLQNKDLLPFLRFALTATKGGPDIPVILAVLGKEESLQRLVVCLEALGV